MARQKGLKNDTNNSTLTFNSRTKAVMADVVQDNVKEKLNSVREVVAGHSNNEIIMVLQYYDYDVEKTIQAFVEDGAKEALHSWQFSGSKPVKKKKNKKKITTGGGVNSHHGNSENSPASPESVSSEAGSSHTGFHVNGDIGIDENQNALTNGSTTSATYPSSIASFSYTNGVHSPSSLHKDLLSDVYTSVRADSVDETSKSEPSTTRVNPLLLVDMETSIPGAVIPSGDAKEKSPAPQPQRQPNHRQRTHSGHGHQDKHQQDKHQQDKHQQDKHQQDKHQQDKHQQDKHQQDKHHQDKHHHDKHRHHDKHLDEGRERTTSTSSTDTKHKHMGLERSSKDLHRQTVSLERLRLVFNEEVDRSYKRIKSVFDEIRNCLNQREALLIGQLDTVRDMGRGTFSSRQGLAAELKTKIDRAERMNETELAQLRSDIKHFVSDRKDYDDLARTTRFLYDDDTMKANVKLFGEVVTLKNSHLPVADVSTVPTPAISSSVTTTTTSSSRPTSTASNKGKLRESSPSSVPHLDTGATHELAELQRRLKHSLTLEGIPVETFPERSESTTSESAPKYSQNPPRPDGLRRNNRNRRWPDRRFDDRRRDCGGGDRQQDDNRATYNQAPNGERVILIGRKTGPQGGSRPPRGGSGRGRGGYRGRGQGSTNIRPLTSDTTNITNQGQSGDHGQSGSQGQTGGHNTAGQGQSGSQGQRSPGNRSGQQRSQRGSPRRGGGRGGRGGSSHGNPKETKEVEA